MVTFWVVPLRLMVGDYNTIIENAKKFLIEFQLDEGEGIDAKNPFYGGIGYGGDDRPDLSNTQLALDAIRAAEMYRPSDSGILGDSTPQIREEETERGLHWHKAIVFLARTQNIKSVNDMPYTTDDGGFIYETGHYKEERSHSYGSMTYAGLKSLLFAGVYKEDIRVKKAISWICSHYTLDENPGFGTTSLYYYYMTAAKCLAALGQEVITDSDGVHHLWREEFIKKLISLQHEDGYWVNSDGRYMENIKDLATAYAVIGMKFAIKDTLIPVSAPNW
jgi:squalene-hopene/tetraprenyl-beta-curcumene cyclase